MQLAYATSTCRTVSENCLMLLNLLIRKLIFLNIRNFLWMILVIIVVVVVFIIITAAIIVIFVVALVIFILNL
jgi:hypothetical protein